MYQVFRSKDYLVFELVVVSKPSVRQVTLTISVKAMYMSFIAKHRTSPGQKWKAEFTCYITADKGKSLGDTHI